MNKLSRSAMFALVGALSAVSASALSQNYPSKPIRFVVGFLPGGTVDLLTRVLGQKMSENWKQQVIVENRAGASGIIASQVVTKAAPDG